VNGGQVIARRGAGRLLVRFDDGSGQIVDTAGKALSQKATQWEALVKDAYWSTTDLPKRGVAQDWTKGEGGLFTGSRPGGPDGFASVDAAHAYGEEGWKSWRRGLSADERDAVTGYLEDVDSVNVPLRDGELPTDFAADYIDPLDTALGRSKIPEDMILYRGTTAQALGADPATLVGKTFKDLGYPSTSLSADIAMNYGDIVVVIEATKGMKGGFIDRTAKDQAESLAPQEAEVLLPRGSSFKVVSFDPTAQYGAWKGGALTVRYTQ
jgi:hypothetical protein